MRDPRRATLDLLKPSLVNSCFSGRRFAIARSFAPLCCRLSERHISPPSVEDVAQFLAVHAATLRRDLPQADLFGRSAFNRYYYAIFFLTREMLTDFDARWRSTPHADVPNVLNGKVRESIQKFKRKATQLGDAEAVSICSHGMQSIADLSTILKQGYSVRVTADYDPTIGISFGEDAAQFSLGNTSVMTAQRWVERAGFLTGSVRRAWKLAHES